MSENKNWKKHIVKKEIREQIKIVVVSLLGALIAAGSFRLYFKFGSFSAITVLICIIDVIYAYFNARLFLTSREWQGVRGIMVFLFLLVYWAVIFAVVAIGASGSERGFFYDLFLYPIFLMPAFVIVIILLGLILQGL